MRRNFKLLFVFALIVALTFAFAACSKTETKAPVETVRWRVQSYDASPEAPGVVMLQKFADEVYARSNGQLQIEVAVAGSLGYTGYEIGTVVSQGLIEMAQMSATAVAGEAPEFGVLELPFMYTGEAEDAELAAKAARPFLQQAADRVNMVYLFGHNLSRCGINSKVEMSTVESFKGKKIRTWSPVLAEVIEALGATPTTIAWAEAYTALATGVAEANITGTRSYIDAKFNEVTPYENMWKIIQVSYNYVVNKDAFNALPEDVQQVLWDVAAEMEDEFWATMYYSEEQDIEEIKALGANYIEVDEAEILKAKEIAQPTVDKWLAGAGDLGKQAYDAVVAAIK